MRPYLLLAALLLANGAAFAQTALPISRPDSAVAGAPAPAAPDTLAALHRLFATRQQRRNYAVGGTLLATAAGVAVVGNSPRHSNGGGSSGYGSLGGPTLYFTGLEEFLVLAFGAVGIGGEVLYYSQYSEKNEHRAAEAFRAHQLPQGLKRKLKPKFFR